MGMKAAWRRAMRDDAALRDPGRDGEVGHDCWRFPAITGSLQACVSTAMSEAEATMLRLDML